MNKKILTLIIVLIIMAAGLWYVALVPKTNTVPVQTPPQTMQPSAAPAAAQTVLSFLPSPLVIASQSATLNIAIDTGANKVTAVQIELAFDPKVIAAVDITPGTFFESPITLLKNIDVENGKITYILAISPTGKPMTGTGTVATVSFTTSLLSGQKTEFTFQPKTLVTAEGMEKTVLKKTMGATIFYVKQASASQGATSSGLIGPVKPQ